MQYAIMTVGFNNSGKSTFAQTLAECIPQLIVLERDDIARFMKMHYPELIKHEQEHPRTLGERQNEWSVRDSLFRVLTEASLKTGKPIINAACNSYKAYRESQMQHWKQAGYTTIQVHFDLPFEVILDRCRRIDKEQDGGLDTSVLEHITKYEQNVLLMQNIFEPPTKDEADYFFNIQDSNDTGKVIAKIQELITLNS